MTHQQAAAQEGHQLEDFFVCEDRGEFDLHSLLSVVPMIGED